MPRRRSEGGARRASAGTRDRRGSTGPRASRAPRGPGVPGLGRLPPGLKVVAAGESVEAGSLGQHGLLEELVGRELFVRAEVEVTRAGHGRVLPAEGAQNPDRLIWSSVRRTR